MKLLCRCEKCSNSFAMELANPEDVRVCLEIDFKEKVMRFICQNIECGHENEFDYGGWIKQQKHSPLPMTKMC